MTDIISNGSTWFGGQPEPIEALFSRLSRYTLDDMFFGKTRLIANKGIPFAYTPVTKINGVWCFFGSFEEVAAVFHVLTIDEDIAAQLREAIIRNPGWQKHIHKCKIKLP